MNRLLIICVLLFGLLATSSAQNDRITITVGMNALQIEQITGLSNVVEDFEAANPDIRLHFVELNFAPTGMDDDAYFAQVEDFVQQADVIAVRGQNLTQRVTLAGYILDLSPLAANNGTYPEPVWSSFQWDGGQWAVPTRYNLVALSYLPAAFDEAGLPYPDAAWTLDDLSLAASELTQTNADGDITQYGFEAFFETNYLSRSAFGMDFTDTAAIPTTALLDTPAVIDFVETWNRFITTTPIGPEVPESGGFVIDPSPDVPLRVTSSLLSELVIGSDNLRDFAPLPGGNTFVEANGLAISAGTVAPEAAYTVATYLASRPETSSVFGGVMPANTQLVAEAPAFEVLQDNGLVETYNTLLENALPATALWFAGDFNTAAFRVRENGQAPAEALAEREIRVQDWQATAQARNGTYTLAVAPPPALEPVAEGDVVLNFGFQSFINPLPNVDRWDAFLAEFAASDPQVGRVDLQVISGQATYTEQFDCFAMPFPIATVNVEALLPLDPLTQADPAFDKDDFLPGTFDGLQLGGDLLGYPLTVQPLVIEYDVDAFLDANLTLPDATWTVDAFDNTVRGLQDSPALSTNAINSTHLLYLTAAFGGLPVDFTTQPPTAAFTDPANIAAIEAVLTWVNAGQIPFVEPSVPGEMPDMPPNAPMMAAIVENTPAATIPSDGVYNRRYVLYPAGDLQIVPFNTRGAYISRGSVAPEACYRLITAIAADPVLLNGVMPARSSVIADPNLAAITSPETYTLYTMVDELLRGDSIPVSASYFSFNNLEAFYYETWLYEAIGRHLNEGVPLADALADAQQLADGFSGCAADVPPRNELPSYQAFIGAYLDCATAIDPDIFG